MVIVKIFEDKTQHKLMYQNKNENEFLEQLIYLINVEESKGNFMVSDLKEKILMFAREKGGKIFSYVISENISEALKLYSESKK